MLRPLLVLIFIILFAKLAFAQAQPRDYAISSPRVSFVDNGSAAVVSFAVSNQGGDALEASQVIIAEYQSGRVEVSERLPALAAGQEEVFSLRLPLGGWSIEGIISFKIEAGIDQFELAGSQIARNNLQLFNIDLGAARERSGDAPGTAADPPPAPTYDLYIPLLNLGVNFNADGVELNQRLISSRDILVGFGLLLAALFCLWLLSLVLRLIFRRPPAFDTWRPPYAMNSWYDPDSAMGRRQSWQFHAQNNIISAQPAPDQVTVIKRLTDESGVALGGWGATALRSAQYDIYGRISRSEVIMPRSINRQFNKLAQRAASLDSRDLNKAAAKIAKRLAKRALSGIEKQNLMLPIAFDMRFEGDVERARVQFELYLYRDEAWHMIDSWLPELGQTGARIPEQFSFALNGQLPGESKREFKARLREDFAQLLTGIFQQRQVAPALPAESPADLPAEADPISDSSLRIADLLASDEDTDKT